MPPVSLGLVSHPGYQRSAINSQGAIELLTRQHAVLPSWSQGHHGGARLGPFQAQPPLTAAPGPPPFSSLPWAWSKRPVRCCMALAIKLCTCAQVLSIILSSLAPHLPPCVRLPLLPCSASVLSRSPSGFGDSSPQMPSPGVVGTPPRASASSQSSRQSRNKPENPWDLLPSLDPRWGFKSGEPWGTVSGGESLHFSKTWSLLPSALYPGFAFSVPVPCFPPFPLSSLALGILLQNPSLCVWQLTRVLSDDCLWIYFWKRIKRIELEEFFFLLKSFLKNTTERFEYFINFFSNTLKSFPSWYLAYVAFQENLGQHRNILNLSSDINITD